MEITCFTLRLETEANDIREKISQWRTAIKQTTNAINEWEVQLTRIEKRIQDLNAFIAEISQKEENVKAVPKSDFIPVGEYTMTNLVDDILKEKGGES